MPSHRATSTRSALIVLAAAAVGLALPGCAVIDEVAYNQRSSTYETLADAPADSVAHAEWVPTDAHDVRIIENARGENTDATVLLASASALDPAVCVGFDRQSAPDYVIDGQPDAYEAETVFACGKWSVIPADDGWLGWTPNHPEEEAQSPAR